MDGVSGDLGTSITILLPYCGRRIAVNGIIHSFGTTLPSTSICMCSGGSASHATRVTTNRNTVIHGRPHRNGNGIVHTVFRSVSTSICIVTSNSSACPTSTTPTVISGILRNCSVIVNSQLDSACFRRGGEPFRGFNGHLIHNSVGNLFRTGIASVVANCQTFSFAFIGACPILSHNFRIRARVAVRSLGGGLHLCRVPVRCQSHPRKSIDGLSAINSNVGIVNAVFHVVHRCGPLPFFNNVNYILNVVNIVLYNAIAISF